MRSPRFNSGRRIGVDREILVVSAAASEASKATAGGDCGSPSRGAPASVREIALILIAAALLTVLFTAPWRPNAETMPVTYAGRGEFFAQYDAGLWIHMLAWGARHPDRLYASPILMPLDRPMVANDPRLTESLWSIPIFRAFDPVTAWGMTTWLALYVTAATSWIAGRMLTGSAWGGAAFAVLFGFGTFRANHVCHIEGLFAPFLPLVPAYVMRFFERPSPRHAVLSGGVAALAAVEYSYTAVALVATIPLALAWGAHRRRIQTRIAARAIGVFLIASGLTFAPVAAIYESFHRETELQRPIGEIDIGGADIEAWLTGPDGRILPPFGGEGAFLFDLRLFPGFVLLGLGFAGLGLLRRRSPELLAVGIVGFLLTFGTMRLLFWSFDLPFWNFRTPYEVLVKTVLPFRAIRAPGRFALYAHLILAVAAALAAARWTDRSRAGRAIIAALLVTAFFESRVGMHEVTIRPERSGDPAYAWVGARPGTFAVLDAPMGFTGPGEFDLTEVHALSAALEHGKATPNGAMALHIPWHLSIQQHMASPRPTETPHLLRALGIRYVVARDALTANSFERVGLRRVFDSPRGSSVLEVDSPLPVPRAPSELQERLFEFPHSRQIHESGPRPCRIEAPRIVSVKRGRTLNIPAIITNTGTETWCVGASIFGAGPRGDVMALVRRWEGISEGTELLPLGLRGERLSAIGYFPSDCAPGESCVVVVRGRAPRRPGLYRAWIDLASADIEWFHPPGEKGAPVLVEVTE
jgi:hypothetical protein